MPFEPKAFQIDDALATSQDVYEVQFSDWGVRTVPPSQTALNVNFQFPPPGVRAVPSTLAAIAIGPRSTVDRCWVSWDRQKLTAVMPGPEDNVIQTESKIRPLSVCNPLSFAQATKNGFLPSIDPLPTRNNDPTTAMHLGLLYAFPKEDGDASMTNFRPNTTILPAKYADETGVVWFLGPGNPGVDVAFQTPYLELLLYLRPPQMALPDKRFPFFFTATSELSRVDDFYPVAQIPIFGRRHIGLGLRSLQHLADFRVGLLRCCRENFIGDSPPFDVPGGSAAAVPVNHTANFSIENPCADYLNVYAKSAAVTFINIELAAYD